jgi:hypothetical protein
MEELKGELNQYMVNGSRYIDRLSRAMDHELYEYPIIIVWKIVLLFLYERLNQVDSEELLKIWHEKYKRKPVGYKPTYLYWPNNEDDDKIIAFIYDLYDIDANVLTLARQIKKKRDTAAHVSGLEFNSVDVENSLREAVKVLEIIQAAHASKLKSQLSLITLVEMYRSSKFSIKDNNILTNVLADGFKSSGSFGRPNELWNYTFENSELLQQPEVVRNILVAILNNSPAQRYHQVLDATGASGQLKRLYMVSQGAQKAWQSFAKVLPGFLEKYEIEKELPKYNWLFQVFDMPQYGTPEEQAIDLDVIPF